MAECACDFSLGQNCRHSNGPWSFGLGPWSVLRPWRPWSLVSLVLSPSRLPETKRQGPGTTKDNGRTRDKGPSTKDDVPRPLSPLVRLRRRLYHDADLVRGACSRYGLGPAHQAARNFPSACDRDGVSLVLLRPQPRHLPDGDVRLQFWVIANTFISGAGCIRHFR